MSTAPTTSRTDRARAAVALCLAVALGVLGMGVQASPAAAASTTTRYMVATTAARASASSAARTTGTVRIGTAVTVIAKSRSWVRLRTGWVPRKAVSNGAYYADRLAAAHGVKIRYTNTTLCGRRQSGMINGSFYLYGCHRPGNDFIELTESGRYSGPGWQRAHVQGVTLHEVAHRAIDRRCHDKRALVASGRSENVADAYAWKYFHTPDKRPGLYGFTRSDLRRATAIHDGRSA